MLLVAVASARKAVPILLLGSGTCRAWRDCPAGCRAGRTRYPSQAGAGAVGAACGRPTLSSSIRLCAIRRPEQSNQFLWRCTVTAVAPILAALRHSARVQMSASAAWLRRHSGDAFPSSRFDRASSIRIGVDGAARGRDACCRKIVKIEINACGVFGSTVSSISISTACQVASSTRVPREHAVGFTRAFPASEKNTRAKTWPSDVGGQRWPTM